LRPGFFCSSLVYIVVVSTLPPFETLDVCGCKITLRRVEGPDALELFFSCKPNAKQQEAGEQAEAIYRAVAEIVSNAGGDLSSLVSETLFVRNITANIDSVRQGRERALARCGAGGDYSPATAEVEQAPLDSTVCLEVLVQAIVPMNSPAPFECVTTIPVCGCKECAGLHGKIVRVGDDTRFYANGIFGRGKSAYQQTQAMFEAAESLLQQAGMAFSDVMRTWIYLREMDRDYAQFNRARREFFHSRGIDPIPASTGIGAGLVPSEHDVCLGVYAIQAERSSLRTVMTTPTLNEAPVYGSDFSRGMRIDEANKVALHVSGTASLDETGQTVHVDDFDAQADRMLVNVAALLQGQGADFGDVVSAMTYLKHPKDAGRLQEKFRAAGYEGFPNVLVEAPVCRPELLCETELLAILPRNGTDNSTIPYS
jgi:enamine deaminase RidA (YjgF/YER057c/UK114 family)